MGKIIGLDFDGVITKLGEFKSKMARELLGLEIPPDEFKKALLAERGILSEEEYLEFGREIYGKWGHGKRMESVDGVFDYIQLLQNDGHKIFIATSRDGEQLEIAKRWTKIHGNGLELDFYGVGYDKSKLEVAVSKDADIFVDDDLKKLVQLVGHVKHLFLFSWGYNSCENVGSAIERIPNWPGLYQRICTL